MWQVCEGRNSCKIEVSNSVFGDPCPRTVKTLAVKAKCKPSSSSSSTQWYSGLSDIWEYETKREEMSKDVWYEFSPYIYVWMVVLMRCLGMLLYIYRRIKIASTNGIGLLILHVTLLLFLWVLSYRFIFSFSKANTIWHDMTKYDNLVLCLLDIN